MRYINAVAIILMVAGAVNWGLVGLFDYDLVAAVFGLSFGEVETATRIVYVLVGVSGIWGLYLLAEEFLTNRTPTSTQREARR